LGQFESGLQQGAAQIPMVVGLPRDAHPLIMAPASPSPREAE
jgi:hypothetical protein